MLYAYFILFLDAIYIALYKCEGTGLGIKGRAVVGGVVSAVRVGMISWIGLYWVYATVALSMATVAYKVAISSDRRDLLDSVWSMHRVVSVSTSVWALLELSTNCQ